nr:uncharacterized protein LOC131783159 isoform X5 [Pocillopora verrucosa]
MNAPQIRARSFCDLVLSLRCRLLELRCPIVIKESLFDLGCLPSAGQIWTSKLQWISWFADVSTELINGARSRLILKTI